MLLLTHPRSGSEWFLSSLPNIKYSGIEFGGLSYLLTPQLMEIDKEITIFKYRTLVRSHKVFFSYLDFRKKTNPDKWDELVAAINKRDDLYLLSRRNCREAILSFYIGYNNNNNFHNSTSTLTTKFLISKAGLATYFDLVYSKKEWVKQLFSFKEEFFYEDLVNGTQTPQTLTYDPSISTVQPRNSSEYYNLIQNFDEVISWMDELGVPGTIA